MRVRARVGARVGARDRDSVTVRDILGLGSGSGLGASMGCWIGEGCS